MQLCYLLQIPPLAVAVAVVVVAVVTVAVVLRISRAPAIWIMWQQDQRQSFLGDDFPLAEDLLEPPLFQPQ